MRFQRNIGARGRWFRGIGALVLFTGGVFLLCVHPGVSVLFFLGGAFLLFEALRGWCALRACGIRTRF
jgi:hypothetical protein